MKFFLYPIGQISDRKNPCLGFSPIQKKINKTENVPPGLKINMAVTWPGKCVIIKQFIITSTWLFQVAVVNKYVMLCLVQCHIFVRTNQLERHNGTPVNDKYQPANILYQHFEELSIIDLEVS